MNSGHVLTLFYFLPVPLFQYAAFLKLQADGFDTLESLTLIVPIFLMIFKYAWNFGRRDTSQYSEEQLKKYISDKLTMATHFTLFGIQAHSFGSLVPWMTPYFYILVSFNAVFIGINGWSMEDPRCQYNYFKTKKTIGATVVFAVFFTLILLFLIRLYIYHSMEPFALLPCCICLSQNFFFFLRDFVIDENGFSLKQVARNE